MLFAFAYVQINFLSEKFNKNQIIKDTLPHEAKQNNAIQKGTFATLMTAEGCSEVDQISTTAERTQLAFLIDTQRSRDNFIRPRFAARALFTQQLALTSPWTRRREVATYTLSHSFSHKAHIHSLHACATMKHELFYDGCAHRLENQSWNPHDTVK
jgi:hypothetical protein